MLSIHTFLTALSGIEYRSSFKHEVTMNIETDGLFHYLSNRIVYRSENQLPSPQARIEVQRFDVDD